MGSLRALFSAFIFCFLAAAVPAQETIGTLPLHRTLAGEPGVSITLAQGGHTLVATSPSAPGVEDLIAPPEPHTASWPSGGMTITVTIYQQPGETDDGVTIRLARRVNALQKSFPIDP